MLAKIPRVNTLNQLVQAKKHWGISVSALNYRLHKLGVVSDWQYRQFNIQIAQNFGRTEPNELKRETSALWEKVLSSLRQDQVTKHTIAEALALPVAELEFSGLWINEDAEHRGFRHNDQRKKSGKFENCGWGRLATRALPSLLQGHQTERVGASVDSISHKLGNVRRRFAFSPVPG